MKRLAAIILLTLCTPALAESPQAPLKIHLAIHDARTAEADVYVTRESPCTEVNDDRPERVLKLTACLKGADLVIDWETRIKAAAYRSRSTLRVARGAQAELGGDDAPHLIVTLP